MLKTLINEISIESWASFLLLYLTVSFVAQQDSIGCIKFFRVVLSWAQIKFQSLEYLFNGATTIDRAYQKAKGLPFEITTPEGKHIMATSPEHLEGISQAPADVLSLHAVAKDLLQPKHTMHGFEWSDVRGVEGTGFVRALRTILTSQLPNLLPELDEVITEHIHSKIQEHRTDKGCSLVPLYDLVKGVVARANCSVFFGRELAEDPTFYEASYNFPQDLGLAAEVIRLVPWPLSTLIASFLTRNFASSKSLHHQLSLEIKRRLGKCDGKSMGDFAKKNDGLQWLIDTAPKKMFWGIDRIVGEVMGVWYASIHTLSMAVTFALLDLYSHPEYIEPLRNEVENTDLHELKGKPTELPLLDSFLSESARLSAFDSTSVRRKALHPFTFSDGLEVKRGEWVCVPHRSMMRDESYFGQALKFDAFRFFGRQDAAFKNFHMTDTSRSWLIWGLGRIQCPGRFYATAVSKLVVARMLLRYDCSISNNLRSRSFQWRSTIVPMSTTTLLVKDRCEQSNNVDRTEMSR